METRANYAIIGLFTMAVIAAGFGFVFWFSGADSGVKRETYRVVFSGSVAGLNKGASVLFNGIRVGEVTRVYYDKDRPQQAFALIEVEPDTPVKQDTRANLDVAILSGAAVIGLTGGDPGAPDLTRTEGQDYPTITAQSGGLASLLETARNTADRANAILDNVNGLVAGNREGINRTLRNVEAFSEALGRNAPALDGLLASVSSAATRVGPLAAKLEELADTTNRVVSSVEPARVSRIVENVDTTLQTVANAREGVSAAVRDAASLAARLNASAPKLDGLLANLSTASEAAVPAARQLGGLAEDARRVVNAVQPERVSRIVANVDGVMATVESSRGRINEVLQNTASLTGRLNESAPKLDGILSLLSTVLDSVSTVGPKVATLTDEATARVRALDTDQVRQIVANTNTFTAGLRASTDDVRQTTRNANELTAKLNAAAGRIDGVLKAAENFLGSAAGEEGRGTFESIRTAMDAFQRASENLNRRATEIAQGVTRLAGSGTRQVDALGGDARRAVNEVGRAARNLSNNPSSIIFGGGGRSSIPEYSGR